MQLSIGSPTDFFNFFRFTSICEFAILCTLPCLFLFQGSDVQKIMRRPEDNEHSLTLLSKEQLKNKSSTNTPNETF